MANNIKRPNLLYFDVEYANSKNMSICQMGLMIEDAITKDPPFPELDIYVNPNDCFDRNCSNVHHITQDKVANEETFDLIWPKIEKYFINSIVVGHNVRSADLNAVCKNLIRYNIPLPEFYYIDTYEMAQKLIKPFEVENYSLSALCKYFDIDIDTEHNAFDDACACSDLLQELINRNDIDLQDFIHHYEFNSQYSPSPYIAVLTEIREINFLFGEIKGIIADGEISDSEKEYIIEWRETHANYISTQYGKAIIGCLDEILEDDIISVDECKRLIDLLVSITQSFSSSMETKATQILQGMVNGIVADSEISKEELLELQKWIYENNYLVGHYPYDKIKNAIETVLEDGIITSKEKEELLLLFDDLFSPVKSAIQKAIVISGNEFVLSGDFSHGSKSDVETYIIKQGGTVNGGVRKKTNFVVVGSNGSAEYSNGNYGTKVKKAMEIGVTVITEKQLYKEI